MSDRQDAPAPLRFLVFSASMRAGSLNSRLAALAAAAIERAGATPDMFSLAQAHSAFDDNGGIADGRLRQRFEDMIASFTDLVEASTRYPCAKAAWVEFLGERPDPAVDRVD